MSKPKGRYPFRVPNNDEGREFIRLCRKYKQDGMVDIKIGTNSSEVRVYVDPCKENPGPEAKAQGVDPFTIEHVKLLERTSEYRDIER